MGTQTALWLVASVFLALQAGPVTAQAVVETQSFDSSAAASSAGWAGLDNTLNGNAFGFSNTNFTGLSGAGEAGGTVARTTNLAYYADLSVGGSPSLLTALHASGELNVVSVSNFNNPVRFGFFNAADTTGFIRFAGFQVAESTTSTQFRAFPSVHFANGSRAESSFPLIIAANVPYTWESDFDPSNQRMSLEFFNAGVSLGVSTVDLSPAQIGYGASFSAFGLVTGGWGQADPSNVAHVYMDNLTYSVTPVPEPSGLCLVGFGCLVACRNWLRHRN